MCLAITMSQLAEGWEDAYKDLPETYRNDSCLEFEVCEGTVFARPQKEQGLGEWSAYWDLQLLSWCDSNSGEPIT